MLFASEFNGISLNANMIQNTNFFTKIYNGKEPKTLYSWAFSALFSAQKIC